MLQRLSYGKPVSWDPYLLQFSHRSCRGGHGQKLDRGGAHGPTIEVLDTDRPVIFGVLLHQHHRDVAHGSHVGGVRACGRPTVFLVRCVR